MVLFVCFVFRLLSYHPIFYETKRECAGHGLAGGSHYERVKFITGSLSHTMLLRKGMNEINVSVVYLFVPYSCTNPAPLFSGFYGNILRC